MPTLINQGKFEMSVQDHAGSSMNDSGTPREIDTPLTQASSPNVLRDLLVKRNRVGRMSRKGKILSNIIKMALHQEEPENDRSWAKHPTQNRPWMMGVQVEALAKCRNITGLSLVRLREVLSTPQSGDCLISTST